MINVGFVSLGCSKNLVDTEIMVGLVGADGFKIVNDEAEADVIIINTCGFIDSAKEEAISTILEMARHKEGGRLKKLIVTGCLAERYRDEVLRELPEVDAVVGVGRFSEIVDIIKSSDMEFFGYENREYPETLPRILSTPSYTAYLKIAEGCDNHCTYCSIPMIRGKYRSRKTEDVLAEAAKLAEGGVREINVIAQDTTRYGLDIYGKAVLPKLLNGLCEIEGLALVRVLYTYPEMIDGELIKVIKNNDKMAKYFDIPIQHSENSVLKRMGRKSRKEGIAKLLLKIREEIPEAVIRTSIIVGFPGETEEDFLGLCKFAEDMQFDRLGVFKYSREEGTPAYSLGGQIDEETKEKRYNKLMEIQQRIADEKNNEKIGKVIKVLIEGSADGLYYGRSQFDAPQIDGKVYIKTKNVYAPGEFSDVKITSAVNYDLIGEVEIEPAE